MCKVTTLQIKTNYNKIARWCGWWLVVGRLGVAVEPHKNSTPPTEKPPKNRPKIRGQALFTATHSQSQACSHVIPFQDMLSVYVLPCDMYRVSG